MPDARTPRLAIMASGRGSNASVLIDAVETGYLAADVALVISDQPDAPVVAAARARGRPVVVIPRTGTRHHHEAAILDALDEAGAEILLLAGYMRILSPRFLERFPGPVLNIHPSLLPDFPGLDAAARQWEAGVEVAGATVHLVDAGVDSGPILLQGRLVVRGDEGPTGLAGRILTEVEHRLYRRAVRLLLEAMEASGEGRAVEQPIRRALISVADKTGVVDLARGLDALGAELIASGGTASVIEEAGIRVRRVEEVTGAPEILGGRVKTMHPAIHAGILADRRDPDHGAALAAHGHVPIDLVVCNLYPFASTAASGAVRDEVVEQIDIGGPALIRAAAKNADGGVTVVSDPTDYARLLSWLEAGRGVPLAVRRDMAARAFALTAAYDGAIADWASTEERVGPPLPAYAAVRELRYGENPHQEGRLYVEERGGGVASGRLIQGKPLSYTNLLDLDAAHRAAGAGGPHRCAVIKHTNPCGLAEAATQPEAFARAHSGDPLAAFGSVLGFNRSVEAVTVRAILDSRLFVECVVAPGFTDDALALLADRPNVRLLAVDAQGPAPRPVVHAVGGGLLVADPDPGPPPPAEWRVVTERRPDDAILGEMAFAMGAAALLTSNAVCVTSDRTLRGAGAGLMSRIDACRLALEKAGEHARGAVLASDAFFPFDDGVRLAAGAGVIAVVQPGGSRRDQEVIDACNELDLTMVFTGRRHFRH
jgi:phosphoribosylaminoimidazolecarboxamide formyltransferase / IMP cyclohydrolase